MQYFLCLVGISGCGKSTYAHWQKYLSDDKVNIVSSDEIRKELYGDESIQTNPNEVFSLMLRRTKQFLAAGESVIYDATNLSDRRRINLLKELSCFKCKKWCHTIISEPEICVENQELRRRKVSREVIYRQVGQFRPPHMSEGWDEITMDVYPSETEEKDRLALWESTIDFNQYSPYHSKDLYWHLLGTAMYAREYKDFDGKLTESAIWHDVGKLFTQKFDENGVAHYYGHENVSAYYYLLFEGTMDTLSYDLDVAWLIAHHMDFYKDDKYLQKLKSRVGDELYNTLHSLHCCDMSAH